jgi:cobalt-zinc-cadmium efflux system outer membrane protein
VSIDPSHALALDECVDLALTNVLTDAIFKARLEAARSQVEAAAVWHNPTIEYTAEDIGLNAIYGNGTRTTRALQQQELVSFPIFQFFTKGLEVDVARAQEARDTASVEDDRRALRLDVGRAFYELLAEEDLVRLEEEAVSVATKLADLAEKRRAIGDGSRLDARRASAEALVARRDLEQVRRKRDLDRLAFSLALGAERPVPVSVAPGWPGALPADVLASSAAVDTADALVARALTLRPDLREAEAELARAKAAVDLEGRRAIPLADWTIGAGGRQGPDGFGAVFTAGGPLPIFDRNQGARVKARSDLDSALAAYEQERRKTAFEVEAALLSWTRSRDAIETYDRPIVVQREEVLEASRRLFAAGEIAYVDLLSAQRDAVEAKRTLVEAERDAAVERWKLVIAVGGGARTP